MIVFGAYPIESQTYMLYVLMCFFSFSNILASCLYNKAVAIQRYTITYILQHNRIWRNTFEGVIHYDCIRFIFIRLEPPNDKSNIYIALTRTHRTKAVE
jgi:hypothetical protein